MNGLLRRLTRRRAATADEPPPETPAASEPVDATVVSQEEGPALSEEERARQEELRRRRRDLPAGLEADRLETTVAEGRPGAIRRRIRYLQAARELLLRDLGGFTYEVYRAGGTSGVQRDISQRKAQRLAAIDDELRTHEAALGLTGAAATVVRQPGIGGTCPACGELHGSDAGWCSHCGTPLTDRARRHAEEATDRAIADREAAEAERAAAAQAAEAERAAAAHAAAAPATAEEPTDEHKRALADYTSRRKAEPEQPAGGEPEAEQSATGKTEKVKQGEQPTTDLGEPVTSEHRQ